MLNTKLKRISLAILAVVLMISVFTMTAFAENENILVSSNPNAAEVTEGAAADDGAPENGSADVSEEKKDESATDEKSDATTGEADDDHAGHDHDDEEKKEDKGFTTSDLVLLIIFVVVVIIAAVVCIIKRERVGKFFRGLKSEFKKIVWSPWNQVRKNTIVVIVVVVALAAIIGALDYLFGQGITELKNLINP